MDKFRSAVIMLYFKRRRSGAGTAHTETHFFSLVVVVAKKAPFMRGADEHKQKLPLHAVLFISNESDAT